MAIPLKQIKVINGSGKETSTLVNDYESVFNQVSFLGRLMNFEYLRICAIKGISPIDMRQ